MPAITLLIIHEDRDDVVVRDSASTETLREIANETAPEAPEGLLVFIADRDDPLDEDLTAAGAGLVSGTEITIARARAIDVHIRYAGETRAFDLAPSRRLKHVLKLALGARGFGIGLPEHALFELALAGHDEAVELEDTLAKYLRRGETQLRLDLRKIVAPQGDR